MKTAEDESVKIKTDYTTVVTTNAKVKEINTKIDGVKTDLAN